MFKRLWHLSVVRYSFVPLRTESSDMHLCLQVTTLLLDKMRRIKNRMVRLKTRVETIRELLEKFLEDEGDMKSMNLTAR